MNAKKIFACCCYGYGVSGMSVLVIGAILPSLIREAGISFTVAGGLLSSMAIGNFMASFFFPVMARFLGKRVSIVLTASFVPISLLVLTYLPPAIVMYAFMFLSGIARGGITILNNQMVNQISGNSGKMLNLLHCSFAVGAFLAPLLTALCIQAGFDWRFILYLLVALNITSCLFYAALPYPQTPTFSAGQTGKERESNRGFLKSFDFYCIGLLLFFYIGVENCINGWFVTYLQSTGVINEVFSATLVSITWIVIMLGRILCGLISGRMKKQTMILLSCTGSAGFFFLLLLGHTLPVIAIALAGLGFCLSGIYPTSIANVGSLIRGSTLGMAMVTAISSLGGIITPQIVGGIADRMGIVLAISFLAVNVILMILFSFVNYRRRNQVLD